MSKINMRPFDYGILYCQEVLRIYKNNMVTYRLSFC